MPGMRSDAGAGHGGRERLIVDVAAGLFSRTTRVLGTGASGAADSETSAEISNSLRCWRMRPRILTAMQRSCPRIWCGCVALGLAIGLAAPASSSAAPAASVSGTVSAVSDEAVTLTRPGLVEGVRGAIEGE
ncbi:MAG: hypothetical protein RLZZ461_1627, partial [Planctomycetota bacterium]